MMMMMMMKMRSTCSSVILGHFFRTKSFLGMPWLKQLVTGLSLWRPVFSPGPLHVGFVWTNWHWDRAFSSSALVFPCPCHSICASQSYFVHLPLILYNLSNWHHHSIKNTHSTIHGVASQKTAVLVVTTVRMWNVNHCILYKKGAFWSFSTLICWRVIYVMDLVNPSLMLGFNFQLLLRVEDF